MVWVTWLYHNWFVLLQSGGIVAGLIFTGLALRYDNKSLHIQNRLSLTTQHREIWSLVYSHPELWRVLDPKADLHANPVTATERLFVNFLILHLTNTYTANKANLFISPEFLERDMAVFFSLPVPGDVWKKMKYFQDSDFVQFVDSSLILSEDKS